MPREDILRAATGVGHGGRAGFEAEIPLSAYSLTEGSGFLCERSIPTRRALVPPAFLAVVAGLARKLLESGQGIRVVSSSTGVVAATDVVKVPTGIKLPRLVVNQRHLIGYFLFAHAGANIEPGGVTFTVNRHTITNPPVVA
eukprot:CAMPEP_0174990574 /NCGR_PEP_ID=MMETSP0004_2-20121128/21403_1 /TAXON_ID=420556 /ORGANISM="Ochromonas sp., Strain CCMP1393" /LENGTH=141 /DNA_ID=CAMNT_0016244209 /DNA_START=1213 /DNA_END=1639 /DNA_ORIENTATION=+